VRILVTYFQDSVNTTDIYPIPKPSLFATATDDEIKYVVNLAHEMGLSVLLSPIVDPNWLKPTNKRSGTNHTWRGEIGLYFTDAQWNTWFANYEKIILHYAVLAQSLHAEQLTVGAELNSPFSQGNQWRQIVQKIRTVYSGSVTAAINFDQALSNVSCTSGMTCSITWFDTLDKIGIDAYFTLNTKSEFPSVEELVAAWQEYIPALEALHTKWGKQILFVEIGYTSSYQPHIRPYAMDLLSADDCSVWALCVFLEAQKTCYEALYEAFWEQNWWDGNFWWLWRTDPHDGFTSDPGFSPVGKPAEQVMIKWFRLQ